MSKKSIEEFDNRLATELLVATGTFTAISSVFVLARSYVRAIILKSFRWDDYLILLAMVSGIALYIVFFTLAKYIRVLHKDTPEVNRGYWRYNHIEIGICAGQNLFSRLSILLAYYRFTPRDVASRSSLWFLNGTFILTLITSVCANIAAMMPCWPLKIIHFSDRFFELRRTGKVACLTQEQIICIMGVVGIATDLLLFALPFALLSHVNLKKEDKARLYVIFGFGFGVLIIGIVRVPFLVQLWPGSNWDPRRDFDQTTETLSVIVHTWIITVAESNYFMVAASLPTLAPLWRQISGCWGEHFKPGASLRSIRLNSSPRTLQYRSDFENVERGYGSKPVCNIRSFGYLDEGYGRAPDRT